MYKRLSIIFLIVAIMIPFSENAFAHKADVVGNYKIEIGWDEEPPIQGIENFIELVVTHATESDRKQAEKMHGMMMDIEDHMNNQINMDEHNMRNYDEKIIPILNQFDSDKITASAAISQISEIINEQKPDDNTGKEIKNLIDDIHSGIITNEDALYALIDILGTISPNEMNHKQMMDHVDMAYNEDNHNNTNHKEGVSGLEDTIQITVTVDDHINTISMSETKIGGIYLGKFTPVWTGYPVVHMSGMIHDTKVDLDMHPEEIEQLNILPPLKQINHGIDPSDVQCKEGLELFMRTSGDSAICTSSDLGQRLMELGVVDYF